MLWGNLFYYGNSMHACRYVCCSGDERHREEFFSFATSREEGYSGSAKFRIEGRLVPYRFRRGRPHAFLRSSASDDMQIYRQHLHGQAV